MTACRRSTGCATGARMGRAPVCLRPTTRAARGAQGDAGEPAAQAGPGIQLNEHFAHEDGEVVFRHACKMELEGIVSKRLGSRYRSGRSPDWLKMKNPDAPAVEREADEGWGR
jgi:hypothetical protein